MKFATRLPSSQEPVLLAALLLGAYLAFDIGLRDSAKAAVVFLLGAQVLSRLPGNPRLRQVAEVVWRLGFVLDFLCRAFLMSVYRTHPDAALVLDAVGNTSAGETLEFVRHHRIDIGIHLAAAACITAASLAMLRTRRPTGTRIKGLTLGLALLVGSHVNATVRAANPFLYWPSQGMEYGQYQDDMDSLAAKRAATLAKLDALEARYAGPAANTVAVVMGESIHRGNWSLYGYPRPTSPDLDARAGDMIVFRNVRAADSNTVGAFRHMMTAQDRANGLKAEDEPSVMLLAKQAGYKTFWISNQHDRYINTRFAQEADVVTLLNQGGRRSDSSLDERLLPAWYEALEDPASKKFIVVHMLGAHPHYEQRRPPHFKPFTGSSDAVTAQMRQAGRMPWIVSLRNEYDNALRYHDRVVSALLDRFKAANQDRPGFFLYTSDHGQDVGHTRNHAGHAESRPGLEVPMLLWTSPASRIAAAQAPSERAYQNDVLDWTMLDLLDISVRNDQPWNSVLSTSCSPEGNDPGASFQ